MPNARQQMLNEGYSPTEVDSLIRDTKETMTSEGYTELEINDALGKSRPDDGKIKTFFKELGDSTFGIGRENIPTFSEYINAGWQQSVTGLALRGELPDITIPDDSPFAQRVAAQTATVLGDIPAMMAGALLVAPAGAAIGTGIAGPAGTAAGGSIGAFSGAFAMPQGLRAALMDGYRDGSIDSFREFWDRVSHVSVETFKGATIGAITRGTGLGAGALVTKTGATAFTAATATLGTEIGTMVTVGSALEGRIPEPHEFLDAAVVIGGLKGSIKGAEALTTGLQNIYIKTGKRPQEVVEDIKQDPSIGEDLAGGRELPRAYEDLGKLEDFRATAARITEPPEVAPKPKPKKPPQTPEEIVLSRIDIQPGRIEGKTLDDIYTQIIDDLHPLSNAVQAMLAGVDIPAEDNPYILARLTRGNAGRAQHWLDYGVYDYKTQTVNSPSLRSILKPVGKNLSDFRALIVAQRNQILTERGIETGISIEAAEQVITRAKPELLKASEDLQIFQLKSLEFIRDSGLISEIDFLQIKKLNPFHIPFNRLMAEGSTKVSPGKGMLIFKPIRTIKGSGKTIIDPLESIIKNTFTYITIAERNRTLIALKNLSLESERGREFVNIVKPSIKRTEITGKELNLELSEFGIEFSDDFSLEIFRAEPGKLKTNQFTLFEDGKRITIEVNTDLGVALAGMDSASVDILTKILSVPAKTLRAGVTADPAFMIRNIIRDPLTAFMQSNNAHIPFWDSLTGIVNITGQTEIYQKWLRSGAAQATFVSLDRNYLQNSLNRLIQDSPLTNQLKTPLDFLRATSELAENSTRVGEFARATARGKTIFEAGFEAREISIDFARRGASHAMQSFSRMSAFLNPKIQGYDRMVRALKTNPMRVTARAAAGIILPSILLTLNKYELVDGEWKQKDWYRRRNDWEKDMYWLVDLGGPKDFETIVKIPKPFEYGIVFGTATERFIEFMATEDPKAFESFIGALGGGLDPVGMTPTIMTPFIEQFANRSLFTGAPLVPRAHEDWVEQYKFTPYTTELTKSIAGILAVVPGLSDVELVSPVSIDNFIRAWTGGLGTQTRDAFDFAGRKLGVLKDPPKAAATLADMPLIKSFLVRNPGISNKPIRDFFDKFNKNQKRVNTIRGLAKMGEIEAAISLEERAFREGRLILMKGHKSTLTDLINITRTLNRDPGISSAEKRQLIDQLYIRITEIAEDGLRQFKIMEDALKEREDKARALSK